MPRKKERRTREGEEKKEKKKGEEERKKNCFKGISYHLTLLAGSAKNSFSKYCC